MTRKLSVAFLVAFVAAGGAAVAMGYTGSHPLSRAAMQQTMGRQELPLCYTEVERECPDGLSETVTHSTCAVCFHNYGDPPSQSCPSQAAYATGATYDVCCTSQTQMQKHCQEEAKVPCYTVFVCAESSHSEDAKCFGDSCWTRYYSWHCKRCYNTGIEVGTYEAQDYACE